MEVDVKDLIERFKDYKDRVQEDLDSDDDFLLAVVIAVLEEVEELDKKETPMKPKYVRQIDDEAYLCPNCNNTWTSIKSIKYCDECGQKLDWSIEEDDK